MLSSLWNLRPTEKPQPSSLGSAFNNVSKITKRLYSTAPKPEKPTVNSFGARVKAGNKSMGMKMTAVGIFVLGLSYAAVPLYRLFCAKTGYGGTAQVAHDERSRSRSKLDTSKEIRVSFRALTAPSLQWSFVPMQSHIDVHPGERALAFFEATNNSTEPIVGVATYHVVPEGTAVYFNKVQCFCFDEQRLNPGETVPMPVHFFIDPEISNDKYACDVEQVILSYTFFKADDQSPELFEQLEKHYAELQEATARHSK